MQRSVLFYIFRFPELNEITMSFSVLLIIYQTNMKIKLTILGLSAALTGFSQSADSVLVKGQIITKDNHPLEQVTIRVSNTDNVVFSDAFGQFELWSPIEGILEFSCISEPYKVSLSSIGGCKENEILKFKFDLKQPNSNYKTKKLKGRTIKVNKIDEGRLSDFILAYYNSDFERITQKHFDYHQSQNHKILFMINGKVMAENFNPINLDYRTLQNVAILRILDSYDKIIFMISTKEK